MHAFVWKFQGANSTQMVSESSSSLNSNMRWQQNLRAMHRTGLTAIVKTNGYWLLMFMLAFNKWFYRHTAITLLPRPKKSIRLSEKNVRILIESRYLVKCFLSCEPIKLYMQYQQLRQPGVLMWSDWNLQRDWFSSIYFEI